MAHFCFDLAVIGSGPAGQRAAINSARMGKRVALIERSNLGGVCIHTGTIPSKAIREATLQLTGLRERSLYGDRAPMLQKITMVDLLHRARHVMRTEVEVIRRQMAQNRITMLFGTAKFTDPNTLQIERREDEIGDAYNEPAGHFDLTDIHADRVLVACGTVPARPAEVPFTPGKVIDSNELLTMKELPSTMIVVGGGVIGTEYACMLAAAGVRVTLVESRPKLLEFLDHELSEALQFHLRDMGIRLVLTESVAKIEVSGGQVQATMASNKTFSADTLLYAVGRQGATEQLNLAAAGLSADKRGRLKVNAFYQTDVPHIYAAGDVIGFPALASTSMEQGRLASCHMFDQLVEPGSPLFPYGIYSIPEISMVGQTEQELTAKNFPYEIGIARYRETARGLMLNEPYGLLKILFHPESRRVLGVHVIGSGATELIHIGQTVIAAGLPVDYFVETIFNYPTLAECYKVAAIDGLSRLRQTPGLAPPVRQIQATEPTKLAA